MLRGDDYDMALKYYFRVSFVDFKLYCFRYFILNPCCNLTPMYDICELYVTCGCVTLDHYDLGCMSAKSLKSFEIFGLPGLYVSKYESVIASVSHFYT